MAKKKEGAKDGVTDKERFAKGHILARVIIEVLGAPKEHVDDAIQLVADKVRADKDVELVSESTYEAEQKGKLFVAFTELEIWFHSTDSIMQFLFNFTPSSLEIMQPSTVSFQAHELSGFFNDFLLKMHDLGLKMKDTSAKMQLLQKNTDALIRNFLNAFMTAPVLPDDLAKRTGIPLENVKAILDGYEKARLVDIKDGKYCLKEKKNG